MRKVIVLAIILCLVLATGAIWRASAARTPTQSYSPIIADLMPGNRPPANGSCSWYDHDQYERYCHTHQAPDQIIWYTVDTRKGQITHSGITVNKSVGELILCWGTPIGIERASYGIYVHWQGRYAYLNRSFFAPSSRVGFVAYYTEHRDYQPWTGFSNRRPATRSGV